ncbi:MAG: tRNA-specific adenosine deaminase [Ectothiorhodospiraceae bacterium]|nr:tRNA-specific adenosine deaminase [Ectothiorhodospiraceae bacterium]
MADNPSARLMQRMKDAVAYSTEHVHGGGTPFSAFVVDIHGTIFGRGVNRVREHHDPSAHAEVEAIRDACRAAGMSHLSGMILMASGEPCAMCYLSALYAGIEQVYFAVDRNEAAAHGFDYRGTYSLLAHDPLVWKSPASRKLSVPEGMQPFLAFRSRVRAHRAESHELLAEAYL